MRHYFEHILSNSDIPDKFVYILNILILCGIITILAIVSNYILRWILKVFIKRVVERSSNKYDDIFYEKGVFSSLSHLAPALIIAYCSPIPFAEFPRILGLLKTGTNIYILVVVLDVLNSFIDALHEVYNQTSFSKTRSVRGYIQVTKTILFTIGGLLVLSMLMKKDISSLLAGVTAFAAVLMFVFKDVIMGLIAGIQISANNIVRIGDQIEMPGRGAEGKVIDITLNTVKVLNSNRTISTIPAYALVSESFQNWRGIELTGGRRIKRMIYIDIRSIAFLSDGFFTNLLNNSHTYDYALKVEKRYENNPHLTNLGVFREYLEEYIKSVKEIGEEPTPLVHHLQPTENGLPLEIVAYSTYTDGAQHEALQNRIFEHLFAILPVFALRVFQRPTGL